MLLRRQFKGKIENVCINGRITLVTLGKANLTLSLLSFRLNGIYRAAVAYPMRTKLLIEMYNNLADYCKYYLPMMMIIVHVPTCISGGKYYEDT